MAKKRKINKLNTYSIIISIILGVLTLLNIYSVIKINVFPFKYLILFFIIFILSIVLIMFNFKLNKKKKKARKTKKMTICWNFSFQKCFLKLWYFALQKSLSKPKAKRSRPWWSFFPRWFFLSQWSWGYFLK